MLDGRIDSQGSVQDLRSQGVLDDIAHDSAAVDDDHEATDLDEETSPTADVLDKPAEEVKKPRKFIEDERRETGGVKWSMYKGESARNLNPSLSNLVLQNTWRRREFGPNRLSLDTSLSDLFRSYWTWAILILVMILTEVSNDHFSVKKAYNLVLYTVGAGRSRKIVDQGAAFIWLLSNLAHREFYRPGEKPTDSNRHQLLHICLRLSYKRGPCPPVFTMRRDRRVLLSRLYLVPETILSFISVSTW